MKLNSDNTNNANSNPYFLQNGGRAAAIIQNIDWTVNPVGIIKSWPENLKNTLSTILSSKFPMLLWWGDDLVQFYNDAFRPSLGNEGKHPSAMGQKAADCWPESWHIIYPLILNVLATGEGVWREDLPVPIYRGGKMQQAYWTFSYSAVRDDQQQIKGVLAVCTETTEKVLYNQNIKNIKEELEFAVEAAAFGTFDLDPLTNRFSANTRLKNWFGLKADDQIDLASATAAIADTDRQRVMESIRNTLDYNSGGSYDIEYDIINPLTKKQKTVHAVGKAWFDGNKNPYRFNGIVQDITAVRKTALELAKARQLTDITIKSMGLGLFNVDFADNNIDYSPQFSRLLTGNLKNNLKRKDFLKYVHPDDLHLRSKAIENGIESGTFFYTPRVVWDDGSIHRIAVSAARIVDKEGNASAFSGTIADITEQEKNRDALLLAQSRLEKTRADAERLFENVTSSSPAGLWLSNKGGMLTYFNKTLIDFTGIPYEELLAGRWTECIAGDDLAKTIEAYTSAVKGQTHFDMLFRGRKSTGELIWCRAAGDPFKDSDGNYAGYAGFCMDMDEIIKGRKALLESQQTISLMIEQSPVAICLFTGEDMKIKIANDIMIGYWGKDASVIGLAMEEAVPELKGQPFLGILQEIYRTGIPYHGKAVPADLNLNGVLSTYYFDFTYTPIRDGNGEIYGIMDIAVDVTEQVMAAKKLQEASTALAGAVELAELATWSLDAVHNTIECSGRFKSWLGIDDLAIPWEVFLRLVPEPNRAKVEASLQEALTGTGSFYDFEFPITNKITAELRIVHANAQIIYSKDGIISGLRGTAQDITLHKELQQSLQLRVNERTAELNTANEELKNTNHELSQFAYIASHDLQEPVRKISVFIDMLENSLEKNPDKAKIYIEKIASSARRMENLIKDVLQFSKLANTSSGFEKVDLNSVISDVLDNFELKIQQKNAVIKIDTLPVIEAVPVQMSQLFGNLISNALKYSSDQRIPEIAVSAQILSGSDKKANFIDSEQNWIKINISDNGIGFEQQYAEQIFNIFQRLHGNERFDGTGIGLALCRKILQNHNGSITAVSNKDIGTVFSVLIPQAQ